MTTLYRIDQLVVDARVADTPPARRLFDRWPGDTPRIEEEVDAVVERARLREDALTVGKRTLLVTQRKGDFLKPCQGMTERHEACCGYAILNIVENCPMDCTYCVLQAYLDNPLVVVYANLDGLAAEIDRAIGSLGGRRRLRVGTGELGDSLALDGLTGLSLDLMRAVEPFDDVVLEFKTKTVEIENLLSVAAPRNVLVSWSLNAPRHVAAEDVGAPSLEARLEAARRCAQHGYRLGFHFDPIIHAPDWETEYRGAVELLFERIDPSRIAYVSLGGLRYPAALKPIVERRFPGSTITGGELVRSWDGKLRYFRPIRVALYRRMVEWIGARAPDVTVYLCMESPPVWADVFGWAPRDVEEVAERLDAACRKAELAGGAVRAAD